MGNEVGQASSMFLSSLCACSSRPSAGRGRGRRGRRRAQRSGDRVRSICSLGSAERRLSFFLRVASARKIVVFYIMGDSTNILAAANDVRAVVP